MTKTLFDQPTKDELATNTGPLLAPLFTWRGRDVYPVFGAEGDGDGDGGEPDSEPDADDADTDDGKGDAKDGGEQPVSRAEFDQLRKQLSAADKKRADAEKRLKDIDDAKKDELTKATERAEALEKTVTAQSKQLSEMLLQNAFLVADTGITWHDPADALDIAERRGYLDGVIGEDGKVDSKVLGTKLKELAKAKPNLVKEAAQNGTSTSTKEEPKSPTGQKVGSKGTSGTKAEDKIPSRYDKFLR